ncbi:hypothetical protein Pla175_35630 [Pirellulimonas nuda]|uniref:Uncharacterized protein n=1 Tax=Pirellulimonas nuda TaxID=2528009 RepID=A0A518DFE9_9BACT|nr:hypothetical protein [Pirellulimonas nuda]QDU90162.1 hypothetical protein Pla175_35630 [Pirellulimonas nuda]
MKAWQKNAALGLLGLLAAGPQIGCRACSSAYDYSSPVANCDCCGCGGRSGTAAGGAVMAGETYIEDGGMMMEPPMMMEDGSMTYPDGY